MLNLGIEANEKSVRAGRDTDERALMTRVAAGDAPAFELLVARHTAMVHAIAWRVLGDATEAEDVVQETFVKLWVNARGWTPAGGGLGGWLRRISTNACLDRLRRPRFVGDEGLPERADEAPPADVTLDATRRGEAIAASIQALPDRHRAAIVLTYHEGVSNAEAAAILGIGVKALESLLVRARQALARSLADRGLLDEGARE
ncbi:MAG: sigma-70 family RNA polymerase sigma factor [Sphingomonas sp.]|nr:sigma-70 family RNA polymerase sigma factor [Sphingomonas sp.]